jgi:hypothetical protein
MNSQPDPSNISTESSMSLNLQHGGHRSLPLLPGTKEGKDDDSLTQMSANIVNMEWNHLDSTRSAARQEHGAILPTNVASAHSIKRKPTPKSNPLTSSSMKEHLKELVPEERIEEQTETEGTIAEAFQPSHSGVGQKGITEDRAVDMTKGMPLSKQEIADNQIPRETSPPPMLNDTTITELDIDITSKPQHLQMSGLSREPTPDFSNLPRLDEIRSPAGTSNFSLSSATRKEMTKLRRFVNSSDLLSRSTGQGVTTGLEVVESILPGNSPPISYSPPSASSPVSSASYYTRDLNNLGSTLSPNETDEIQPGLEVLQHEESYRMKSPPPPFSDSGSPDISIPERGLLTHFNTVEFESGLEVNRPSSVKSRIPSDLTAKFANETGTQWKLNIPLQQTDAEVQSVTNSVTGESTSSKRKWFSGRLTKSSNQGRSNSTNKKLPQYLEHSFSTCGHRILLWSKRNSSRLIYITYPFEHGGVYDLAHVNTMGPSVSNATVNMRFVASTRERIAIIAYADEVGIFIPSPSFSEGKS